MNKNFNYKFAYNLKIDNEKGEKKRVTSKIFKHLMKIISMVME